MTSLDADPELPSEAALGASLAVQRSEEVVALFEQAPGFFAYLRGPGHVFELANAAYSQVVGHRRVLGKGVREALPELAGQGFYELLDEVRRTGIPYVGRGVAIKLQNTPGAPLTEAYLDFIYQPIRGPDGGIAGILVQGSDVTAGVVAEQALRASEQRYRTLFESIDDGFCLMQMIDDERGKTVDYRFLETNAAFERQTGLVGVHGRTARELVPNLDESWFELYGKVAHTGETARFENHAPAMNRWFDVYAIRFGEAALLQVALVFKDITESKLAEQERARLLQRETEARKEAEAAGRLRDEFLATVSHELRTPLSAILGWVQMLRSGALGPEKASQGLETIERNARAQTQLIEDLLDVSRILAGKLRLEVDAVAFEDVVVAAIETARPAAEAREIRLQPALSSGAIVMGDANRLQQVVWNLLANAVKFTPRGGRVQITVELKDSAVVLAVADTGQGIAPDFQAYVFDRFRQAASGSDRGYGGLGLGLSIVRQLVELHGGSVSVTSEGVGKGSTFFVKLPLAIGRRRDPGTIAGAWSSTVQALPGVAVLAGFDILVVDDEKDSRELLQTLLTSCGMVVRAASSVAEAMAAMRERPPELLLSDIGMPNEDGYALIERVRGLPALAGGDVPAVALTAYARSEDRTRALLAGFTNHVPKPVEPAELLAVLASLAIAARRRSQPA